MAKPSAVITVHGIRTRGEWQKGFSTVIAQYGMIPYLVDYGHFNVFRMLIPFSRENQLAHFRKSYDDIVTKSGVTRPHVVAHSFGSWLVCETLRRFQEVKFGRVILAGSIVREDFPWQQYIDEGRVLSVRNQVATQDIWPMAAQAGSWFLRWPLTKRVFGRGGVKGFDTPESGRFKQIREDIGHSDTFSRVTVLFVRRVAV